jgi:hypothetical protein
VSHPGRFLARPIVQEVGWAPGPVCAGAENLVPTGIRYSDLPARSQSLYRLSYPAHSLKAQPVKYSFLLYTLSGLSTLITAATIQYNIHTRTFLRTVSTYKSVPRLLLSQGFYGSCAYGRASPVLVAEFPVCLASTIRKFSK